MIDAGADNGLLVQKNAAGLPAGGGLEGVTKCIMRCNAGTAG